MEEQATVNEQTGETVRIYREGMPAEGSVVTLAELEAMLNDGRLTGHDLIFHEGGWRLSQPAAFRAVSLAHHGSDSFRTGSESDDPSLGLA